MLNCLGGDVSNGLAIYDMIQSSKAPMDIEVYGKAMSMATIILQAGRNRYLHENATILVHNGDMTLGTMGFTDAKNFIDSQEQQVRNFHKILSSRSTEDIAYWEDVCRNDQYFTAREAVKKGLADKVIKYNFC